MSNLFGEAEEIKPAAVATDGAYRVLARKYRPTKFSQLIGQDALVRTLTNAFTTGRLAHAWMMTGVRGVGKTTTARIIARALNCTGVDGNSGPTVEPCGICPTCVAIAEDRCVDVIEMDAATHTGIDNMRELMDGMRYAPTMARYKVYIIDEVHQLSKNTFNALLKTLEEPPPHVKFIFATTEIRKVPVTVLSRCQRFDLRRVPSDILFQHFVEVSAKESIAADEAALRLIARAADGSVRDGLSLLDQAMSRVGGADGEERISIASVQDMLGLADRTHIVELLDDISKGEAAKALEKFQDMVAGGADALTMLQDLAELIHLLTRGKLVDTLATDPSLSEIDRGALARLLPQHTLQGLARLWQIILKTIGEVQAAPRPLLAAEMALVRLCYAATLPTPGELLEKFPNAASGGGTANFSDATPERGRGNTLNSASVAETDANQTPPRTLKVVGGSPQPKAKPQANTMAVAATKAEPTVSALTLELASDYKKLVHHFLTQKEIGLHAELFGNVRLVSLAPGRLEIQPLPGSPRDLAARLTKSLTEWTGDRWIVALTHDAPHAQPTLAEADRAAADTLRQEALADPVVMAALAAFPGAELKAIKPRTPRTQAEIEAPDDPAPSDIDIVLDSDLGDGPDPADD